MLAHRKVASATVLDPGADLVFPVMVCPADHTVTVEKGWACVAKTIAASVTNFVTFTLINGGTAGTATTEIGAVTGGGTLGMVAYTPQAIAITAGSGRLTAGQFLMCKYDETSTVDPDAVSVIVEYVDGLGGKRNA